MKELKVPTDCPDIRPHYKPMTLAQFLDHCIMCGGNWTAMLMSGLKYIYHDYWTAMPDRPYSFEEICDILIALGVEWEEDED